MLCFSSYFLTHCPSKSTPLSPSYTSGLSSLAKLISYIVQQHGDFSSAQNLLEALFNLVVEPSRWLSSIGSCRFFNDASSNSFIVFSQSADRGCSTQQEFHIRFTEAPVASAGCLCQGSRQCLHRMAHVLSAFSFLAAAVRFVLCVRRGAALVAVVSRHGL